MLMITESVLPRSKMYESSLWEISTCHITLKDDEILSEICHEQQFDDMIVWDLEPGYLIVRRGYEDSVPISQYEDEGFSPEFIYLIRLARLHHIEYIRLDPDAPEYSDYLKEFEW